MGFVWLEHSWLMLAEAIDMQQVLVLSLFQSSWFWFLILLLALFLFLYCLERRRVIREKTLFFASKSLFLFFSVVTVIVAFVLFGSAEEWCDGSHWHAGGAGGVTDRMLLEPCMCVWPKVAGSQPHPTLFHDADLLPPDASVRRAQLVLTIGWCPCRRNIMIHECSECPDSCTFTVFLTLVGNQKGWRNVAAYLWCCKQNIVLHWLSSLRGVKPSKDSNSGGGLGLSRGGGQV